jgi:tight adherence protein B
MSVTYPARRSLPRPTRRSRSWAALATCLLVILAIAAPATAADEEPDVAAVPGVPFTVTGADGSAAAEAGGDEAGGDDEVATFEVVLTLFGLTDPPGAGEISLIEGENERGVTSVTATGAEHPVEIVYVVDTNARAAEGVLDEVKKQIRATVADLTDDTAVGLISAGDSAVVLAKPTTDRDEIDAAIDDLQPRNGSALLDGIDRAGSLFGDDTGVVRSVVVLATGGDNGSNATRTSSQVGLVRVGAQLINVAYEGGERALTTMADETRGATLSAGSEDEIGPVLERAGELARERVLVTFDGTTETGRRGNVTITIGDTTRELAYPSGSATTTVLQLSPQPVPDPPGLALFRSSLGLYLALILAFAGISAGVWSLGSIMAGGQSNLEGMLSSYTDGGGDGENTDVEELIVQSALLQRAVTLSESFAEKRGFLARVEEMLERANLPIRAGEAMFMLAAVLVLSGGLVGVLTRSLLVSVLLSVAMGALTFFFVRFKARRRFKAFESLLPDTLQLLAGTLRAGYSLPQGLEVVSKEISDPMGQELRRAMTEARLGRDLEDCLSGVSDRMTSADFAWAVMAISIQREVGGNLNELLLSVADTMIARERLKREIGALTAEGKMSAAVLSFLPPGLGLVMWVMNPDYVNLLFTEVIGNVMLGLGLVSALIGLAWMKKVITVDV